MRGRRCTAASPQWHVFARALAPDAWAAVVDLAQTLALALDRVLDRRDTPTLTLLKVTADSGEYWDQSTIAQKLRFMVETGKAFLTGRSADPASLGDNQKVKLTH